MKVISITGGIGNQLFQYAFAKTVEKNCGQVFLTDETARAGYRRAWELHHFSIRLPVLSAQEARQFRWFGKTGPFCFLPPYKKLIQTREESHYFPHRHLHIATFADDVYSSDYHKQGLDLFRFVASLQPDHHYLLRGHWQSASMINNIKEDLTKDLIFSTSPGSTTKDLLKRITATPQTVAVHLRTSWRHRGDNSKIDVATSLHPQAILPLSYYQKAIHHIRKQCSTSTFFIFADEITAAASLLSKLDSSDDFVYIEHNSRMVWEDLLLMQHCTHFVLSNSTFAWWGCWLAQVTPHIKNGICIMPRNWLGYDAGELFSLRLKMGDNTISL